jgi:hypothetical protein
MEVHLTADLQAKVNRWVADTGHPTDELFAEALTGHFAALSGVRELLDSRYDDIESGKVQPIDGEEAYALLKAEFAARRTRFA